MAADALKTMKVLVPQAEALGMLAVIRALGRAGIEVHAASSETNALGLKSSYAARAIHCPPFRHAEFIPWLEDYVRREGIGMLVPTEHLMLALGPVLDRFAPLLPIQVDAAALQRIYSKARTQVFYQQQGLLEHMPDALVLTADNSAQELGQLERLVFPVFVKTDAVDHLHGWGAGKGEVIRADTAAQARGFALSLLERFSHVLIQGFVPGQGAGVNALRWQGRQIATYVNLCDHESPHTGGLCTLRRSWDCPQMTLDALRRLEALDWHGVAMVEYRFDPASGKFYCIEINARFWAALHLALHAGADFPLFLAQLHAGLEPQVPQAWQQVSCCYDIPGEIAHVSSLLKDPGIGLTRKLGRMFGFFGLYLNPGVKLDMSFAGDRKLYFIQLARFLGLKL